MAAWWGRLAGLRPCGFPLLDAQAGSGRRGAARASRAIARAGVCSRREAERLIRAGRVSVGGKVIHDPALTTCDPREIAVDGKPLETQPTRVFLWHKAPGLITSRRDPFARWPTVFDQLPPHWPRVVSVGRLDVFTEGLLVFTNDGALAGALERSRTPRTYRVTVSGALPSPGELERMREELARGITLDGMPLRPIDLRARDEALMLTLLEGKNREVRRIMSHLGLRVQRLCRERFGPWRLARYVPGRGDFCEVNAAGAELVARRYGASRD